METILKRYDSSLIGYWHDTGHGQIRQNLGFISYRLWLDKLAPRLAGLHIHDVLPPARDHLMPPKGKMDFIGFKTYLKPDMALVLEPAPHTPEADIREGAQSIREAWGLPAS
jgi:sugar phosphate isomerase/epimerase